MFSVCWIEKYNIFTCWHDHVGQLFQAWEEDGREAGCSCRAWNGEEEKDIYYVHERMELNFNKGNTVSQLLFNQITGY